MTVKKTKYEIEVAVNPFRNSKGEEDDSVGEIRKRAICGSVYFSPASRVMRGAFDPALLTGVSLNSEMQKFFERTRSIPGERIWIDLRSGKWGTYDPLHQPESAAMQRKAERVNEAMKSTFTYGKDVAFTKPFTADLRDESDAKNVLYWMARMVESRKAAVPSGCEQMPSVDEVRAMPGRRDPTQGFRSTDPDTRKFMADFDDYVAPEKAATTK
jgi:hypothetical protein